MKKVSKKTPIISSVVIFVSIVVLLVSGFVFMRHTSALDKHQPACKPIDEKEYIGLNILEAARKANDINQEFRLNDSAENSFVINSDRNNCRINFTTEKQKVIKAEFY